MRAAFVAAFVIGCGGMPTTSAIDQADTVCGQGPTVKGIDVSYYQGDIDWSAVAGDGVEFAFIRVSDGTTYVDPRFDAYWAGSRAAGIVHGAYQFFRPGEDPIAQADLLLAAMGPMQPDDLPPVIDVEASGGLSSAEVADRVRQWTDYVSAAIGRAPSVYTGKYFWDDSVGATDLGGLPLWHAQYTSASCPDLAATWSDWAIWQYTSSGKIAGISGGVDTNRWNGDRASLDAFLGGPARDCEPLAADGGEIDNGDGCYSQGGPARYMRQVADAGEQGDLVWTHATDAAAEANYADWEIGLSEAGRYRVEVYTATGYAMSKQAAYLVTAAGSTTSVTIDQTAVDGWQALGEFDFAAGGDQGVHLGDNTGEAPADNVQLAFDAVRLTRTDPAPTDPMGSDPTTPGDPMGGGGGCGAGGGGGGLGTLLAIAARLLRRRTRKN